MTTDQADPAASGEGASAADAPDGADAEIEALSFDAAFAELRQAIEELEAGGLALEETIRRTERAVALQRHCERLLSEAELRVKQLVARPGGGLETRDVAVDEVADA